MGLNGHTVQFKPELYSSTCRLVRDYHGMDWDVGDDTSYAPTFPLARNNVNWEELYGSWLRHGFEVDVSVMIGAFKPQEWKDLSQDAFNYGRAFAGFFGPSNKNLVSSAEVGNEPQGYSDAEYRTVLESMARGFREGDPKLTVLTANMTVGESGEYDRNIEAIRGLEDLYDVINMHVYAMAEPWPTWRRSHPEDPKIDYLDRLRKMIAWRDANASGKEIWITEFGWDASTQDPAKEGTFAKWVDVTDEQQAQYLVRSHLVFSRMDIDRAYIYWFNDDDTPQLHGSSGLTRNFEPKPAYHAVQHLYRTLGDYRFIGALLEDAERAYTYEYAHRSVPSDRIVVVWSPTGSGAETELELSLGGAEVLGAERTPLTSSAAPEAALSVEGGVAKVTVTETPLFVKVRR